MLEESEKFKVPVYIAADNITSTLGRTIAENFESVKQGRSCIKHYHDPALSAEPLTASLFQEGTVFKAGNDPAYTRFEQLLIISIKDALLQVDIDLADEETILI